MLLVGETDVLGENLFAVPFCTAKHSAWIGPGLKTDHRDDRTEYKKTDLPFVQSYLSTVFRVNYPGFQHPIIIMMTIITVL